MEDWCRLPPSWIRHMSNYQLLHAKHLEAPVNDCLLLHLVICCDAAFVPGQRERYGKKKKGGEEGRRKDDDERPNKKTNAHFPSGYPSQSRWHRCHRYRHTICLDVGNSDPTAAVTKRPNDSEIAIAATFHVGRITKGACKIRRREREKEKKGMNIAMLE